jgi:hypothetical protein
MISYSSLDKLRCIGLKGLSSERLPSLPKTARAREGAGRGPQAHSNHVGLGFRDHFKSFKYSCSTENCQLCQEGNG